MTQITAKLPPDMSKSLDSAARRLKRSRADVIRQAIEYYLDDVEDLERAMDRLRDPADPVLDWEKVRRELVAKD
ncbi:MAG: ribbon-helix-helix protein, CopG family [Gammaproteobacteria bacterium]|nr:ribbon-helix-helix protein, CopG family [Gammaproteobacteria bacterium]